MNTERNLSKNDLDEANSAFNSYTISENIETLSEISEKWLSEWKDSFKTDSDKFPVFPRISSTSPPMENEFNYSTNLKLKKYGKTFHLEEYLSKTSSTEIQIPVLKNEEQIEMIASHPSLKSNISLKELSNKTSEKVNSAETNIQRDSSSRECSEENIILESSIKQIFSNLTIDYQTLRFSNDYTDNSDNNIQKTWSFLREIFLKLIVKLSENGECEIQFLEKPDLFCKVKAFHPDFDCILINENQFRSTLSKNNIISTDDIVSMHFYDIHI